MDTSRSLVVLGLLASLGATPLAGQPGAPPADDVALGGDTLDRAALIAAVLERNPGIAAARQAWQASREQIPQARSLDHPTARYGLAPLSIASDDAPFGHQLEVAQRFPYPGTLRLRGEIAAAEAAAAEQEIEEVRLRLATMASLLFDDYYAVGRALAVNEEHRRLLEGFRQVATARYAAGLAPQQAPIQAEVEAAHLLHAEVALESDRRTLAAQLNALLHRPPRAPLPPPPDDPGPLPTAVAADSAAATMVSTRPELAAQRAEIAARRTAVALEKLAFHPDFEVMASYNSMWDMTEHQWMVGVGIDLPIRRQRVRAAVAAAEARLASAESELARLEDAVAAEVVVAAEELREALHVVHLYRNRVLPAARDLLAAARAGFETGAVTMLDLIEAGRSLRTAELNHDQALADAFSRRAELDRALGRLPFAETAPATPPPTASDATETER